MGPTVLTGANLSGLIYLVLEKHTAPSVIIVCMARDEFFEQLLVELSPTQVQTLDDSEDHANAQDISTGLLQQPALRVLATSQTIRLVFCPDLSHLRAYLSVFSPRQHTSPGSGTRQTSDPQGIMAILNLLEIHRPTSAFSAQGLNRTFSAAVEAAQRTGSRLIVAECVTMSADTNAADPPGEVVETDTDNPRMDPWNEEVSILNVTTKSFGAGGRGWVGRTVKLRHIAERWCRFESAS